MIGPAVVVLYEHSHQTENGIRKEGRGCTAMRERKEEALEGKGEGRNETCVVRAFRRNVLVKFVRVTPEPILDTLSRSLGITIQPQVGAV